MRQRIEKLTAVALSKVPPFVAKRLKRPRIVDGETLDPHLRLVLAANESKKGFESVGPEAAREAYRHIAEVLQAPPSIEISSSDRVAETTHGPVPIRVYECSEGGLRPCVVFFHGGGHVIGDLDTHDGFCSRLCGELGATIIAVDYPVAPEAPFPAAVNCCQAATQWVVDSSASLGIDDARIAVAGDSAGGNLAAVVSQEVQGIAFQLLIYPGTNFASQTPSKELFSTGYGLDQTTIQWFLEQYCQDSERSNPRVSPALSTSLGRSPKTHIATAGFDPLRDEAMDYAELLKRARVDCTIENHSTLTHGFIHFTRIRSCNESVEKLISALRQGLA